jgi:H+/Cl- antiporter ClcA
MRLMVVAAGIGIVAAAAGAVLLWLLEVLQESMFEHLPAALGFADPPWWWPLPMLAIGLGVVLVVQRLPRGTGASPIAGFHFDTPPATALLALVAAIGTLGFGFVLGPEAALILIGTMIGALIARALGRGDDTAAVRAFMLLGGVAAIGTVFGNPFVTAFMLLELAAFGALPAALLVPSLIALASGYLVQIGIWAIPGIGVHGLAVPGLPTYASIGFGDLLGGAAVAVVAAAIALVALTGGRSLDQVWQRRRVTATAIAAAVTAVAVVVAAALGIDAGLILFSGNAAMPELLAQTSLGTVITIVVTKAAAYAAALGGGFRGGPVFPATFLGVGVGVAAALIVPALALPALVAAGIAAACAAVIRLPATSALLAFLLVGAAGVAVTPLAIIGAVIGAGLRRALDAAAAARSEATKAAGS